jgi:hypothetical protein
MADLFGRDKSVISNAYVISLPPANWTSRQLLQKMQQLMPMARPAR